jgi:hypothetical protein
MQETGRMQVVIKSFRELSAEEFFRITSDLFDECGILHKTMEILV